MRLMSIVLILFVVHALYAHDEFALALDFDDVSAELQFTWFLPSGHDDFSLGNFNKSWDESERYELLVTFDDFRDQRRSLYGAVYLFWEDRSYASGAQWLDARAFGGGYEVGGRFWMLEPAKSPPLNLGLSPYGRIGAAIQDVDFENIDTGSGAAYGGVDVERLEFMLGLDGLLYLSNGLHLSLGVAAQFWFSDNVGTTRAGDVVSTESFNGDAILYRFTLGWCF